MEVLSPKGLVRYLVLLLIDLKSRTVEISDIVRDPAIEWMKQVARNLAYAGECFLRIARYLIHGRDPLLTPEVRGILEASRSSASGCLLAA